jgi:hypothetical protein
MEDHLMKFSVICSMSSGMGWEIPAEVGNRKQKKTRFRKMETG